MKKKIIPPFIPTIFSLLKPMDFPHPSHHPNPQLHSQQLLQLCRFIQTTTPQLKSKRRSSPVPMSTSFPQPPPQFNNLNLNPAAAIANPISMDAQLQSALDHIDELITDHVSLKSARKVKLFPTLFSLTSRQDGLRRSRRRLDYRQTSGQLRRCSSTWLECGSPSRTRRISSPMEFWLACR